MISSSLAASLGLGALLVLLCIVWLMEAKLVGLVFGYIFR